MKIKQKTGVALCAIAALALSCVSAVHGDERMESDTPMSQQEFIAYALANGDKTYVGDTSWIKGFNAVYMYRGEFRTDFTTDHKPGKKLEPPKNNFIRYTLVDSKPVMTSPDSFGQDEGKDVIYLQLYNSEAREYVLKHQLRMDLVKLTGWGYKERVYSHCYDIGGDGFNDLYDSIVDEHNILELERPIAYAQAGNMKWIGKKNKAVYQGVCDVLTAELYKSIAGEQIVDEQSSEE